MADNRVIQGFIKRFTDEQAVIDCIAERKTINLKLSRIPTNAHIGDFIIFDEIKNRCTIDYQITKIHEQELRRLSDSYFG